MSANPRIAEYTIHPQFIERWSPRAFTGESIGEETLLSFSLCMRPWRSASWETNRRWPTTFRPAKSRARAGH